MGFYVLVTAEAKCTPAIDMRQNAYMAHHSAVRMEYHVVGTMIRCSVTLSSPGSVAESEEHGPRMREIVGLNPGRVKSMTYQIYTCSFLVQYLALLGWGEGWLA